MGLETLEISGFLGSESIVLMLNVHRLYTAQFALRLFSGLRSLGYGVGFRIQRLGFEDFTPDLMFSPGLKLKTLSYCSIMMNLVAEMVGKGAWGTVNLNRMRILKDSAAAALAGYILTRLLDCEGLGCTDCGWSKSCTTHCTTSLMSSLQ